MEIDLSRNQLEEFPSEGFPKLEWLDITKNKVKELPHATLWPNIKSFWATKNQIKTVPVEFCNPRLDTVNLRNHLKNKIGSKIDRDDFQIILSNNELKTLPDEFGNLSLISLWLSENQFKEIPECIFR